ncbi:uncharacterized protein SPSK_10302 [Sporothrix schenckii 1099-18]|uniref:Uncharacterized protein n=1 Tax=Sporothrix schenckii 1099-18 TaxID=1397361 RepID=A0A0F2M2U3_SPOSC|nr:uncharacterized protein SPSK_10302 [Sporothrix schenckii 1099-18]KJR84028.1 hypothetical protein SPSK_10302 [Sporothrix schenckii 1099-18]
MDIGIGARSREHTSQGACGGRASRAAIGAAMQYSQEPKRKRGSTLVVVPEPPEHVQEVTAAGAGLFLPSQYQLQQHTFMDKRGRRCGRPLGIYVVSSRAFPLAPHFRTMSSVRLFTHTMGKRVFCH